MNQSLTYLLTHVDTLSKEDESYIAQKIQSEPFVQGWKILLSKIQNKKKNNFGFYQSNNLFANDILLMNNSNEEQAVINLGTNTEVKTIYFEPKSIDSKEDNTEVTTEGTQITIIKAEEMNDINSSQKDSNIDDEKKINSSKEINKTEDSSGSSSVKKKNSIGKVKKKKHKKYSFKKEDIESSDYTKWLLTLEPLEIKKFKKKKKKHKKEHKLAKSSVTKKKSVISESLANLLIDQGHTNEGIEMYRQLSLVFPEKSAYFAAKILEINNLK
jgi:hypothetical protein